MRQHQQCSQPHVVRNGSLSGRQRYHCRGCGAWFGQTRGTPLYRLRTPPQEIARALLVVMRRGSLRAASRSHWPIVSYSWPVTSSAACHAAALSTALVRDLHVFEQNWLREHPALREPAADGGWRFRRRSPAIALGLAGHIWSWEEFLTRSVPVSP